MQRKLLLTYILLIIVTMVFAVGLSYSKVNDYFFERVENETKVESAFILKRLEEGDISKGHFQTFVNEYASIGTVRITLIDSDGYVLADSDYDANEMDNHMSRPEVLSALKGEEGISIRYSNTMKTYFFYYASPVNSDSYTGALRVSVPVNEISGIISDMLWIILIGIGVGSLVAFLVAYIVTNKLMKPINELTRVAKVISEGEYDEKIYISQKDQIGELAEAFNGMTHTLRLNMWNLAHKNAELESILTSMSDGLVAIDVDYKIALHNSIFTKMLGLTDEDYKDKLFYEVTRELSIFNIIEKSLEHYEYIREETTMMYDGEERIIRLTATPIFAKGNNNKALGILLILTDITEIRRLENVRRDFVSNVTHELKTPLTSIKGFVDTLKNGAINDQKVALKFLDIIDIEADRLSNLIQDILSLSEIEAVVGEKNIAEYSLSDIVNEVMDIVLNDKVAINIIIDIEENLPIFRCNKDRMKQLFINLIDNAIKYTEEGYVKVICSSVNGYLYIEIEDTGIGIEYKHLSRIFERFYRVDKGRSRKVGGTGLGLSIVKHIVELYCGEINIDSEVGRGTIIKIRLPY